jgi:hypothetical protein
MKTNDLKKGHRVKLANGFMAVIDDNLRGNTRQAVVHGYSTDTGSVYSHDIAWWRYPDNMRVADMPTGELMNVADGEFKGFYGRVEHTEAQKQLRKETEVFFGMLADQTEQREPNLIPDWMPEW